MPEWTSALLSFFLRGITLKELIHMLIIFIAMIVFTPDAAKEWVNTRNPEIFPNYGMYYLLLVCLSYVANTLVRNIFSFFSLVMAERRYRKIKKLEHEKHVVQLEAKKQHDIKTFKNLSVDEQICLMAFCNNRVVELPLSDPTVWGLANLGIIQRVASKNTSAMFTVCDDYIELVDDLHQRLTTAK